MAALDVTEREFRDALETVEVGAEWEPIGSEPHNVLLLCDSVLAAMYSCIPPYRERSISQDHLAEDIASVRDAIEAMQERW